MLLHKELTDKIIGCYYNVYNGMGFGFLENVYENALMHEFELQGIKAVNQAKINVFYKDKKVGSYFADILVEDKIILELKATPLIKDFKYQLYHYLKSTDIEIGYLMSFGKKAKYERVIFTNDQK